MDYYKKYLKYKLKYLQLRQAIGSGKVSKRDSSRSHKVQVKRKFIKPIVFKKSKPEDLITQFKKYEEKKDLQKKQSVYELSGKIQWLIDLAGTDEFINLLIEEFTGDSVNRTQGNDNTYNVPNTLYFYTRDGNVGHWIYVDATGSHVQSYTEGHQKSGTNQFCQSFALIYMFKNFGQPEYYNRLVSTNTISDENQKYQIWGHNIEVVLSFYMDLFTNYFSKEQQDWIIDQLKSINEEYKTHNLGQRSERNRLTLIAEDSNLITMDLVKQKLAEIYQYRVDIARET